MTNTYEVGDRVKVLIKSTCEIHGETKTWEEYFAGTIITYHLFTDKTGEEFYLYKVSVDGLGDIKFARELEDGSLQLIAPTSEVL